MLSLSAPGDHHTEPDGRILDVVNDGSYHRNPLDTEQEIKEVDITLSTVIGTSTLSLRNLLQLQQGDVLCLDKPVSSELMVQIDGKTKMAARPG